MNCSDYRDKLSAYADGALEAAEQSQLQAHLNSCANCAQEFKALKEMVQALRTMELVQVPDLLPGIHRRLQPAAWWQRFTVPWPVSLPWHGLALATTALLVVLVMRRSPSELARPTQINGLQTSFDQVANLKEAEAPAPVVSLSKIARLSEASFDKKRDELKARVFEEALTMPQPVFEAPQRLAQAAAPATFGDFENRPDDSPADAGAAVLTVASETDVAPRSSGYLSGGGAAFLPMANGGRLLAERIGREEKTLDQFLGARAKTQQGLSFGSSASVLGFLQPAQVASNSSAPDLLQMRWQTDSIDETVSRVAKWAEAHQGFATLTTPEHLSVILPGSFVPQFLQEFSGNAPFAYTADASAAWVTISIDLIASQ